MRPRDFEEKPYVLISATYPFESYMPTRIGVVLPINPWDSLEEMTGEVVRGFCERSCLSVDDFWNTGGETEARLLTEEEFRTIVRGW